MNGLKLGCTLLLSSAIWTLAVGSWIRTPSAVGQPANSDQPAAQSRLQSTEVRQLLQQSIELTQQGKHSAALDEKNGIQAPPF
jgi:hypothetical protein